MRLSKSQLASHPKLAKLIGIKEYGKCKNSRKASSAKPEQIICHEPLGPDRGKKENPSRALVSVKIQSFRRRLLDADNLAGGCKYFVDALRYENLIANDDPKTITLEISQTKVKRKEEERTEIEISEEFKTQEILA